MTQSIELIGEYKINQFSKDTDNMVKRLCDKCSDYYMLLASVFGEILANNFP